MAAQSKLEEAALRLFAERGVTHVSVSDLAQEAGVARGTVYNNVKTVESLFEDVATRLTTEMSMCITASLQDVADPAMRLAFGMRFFIRRAHQEPVWGRFIVRFGATTPTLRSLLEGAPSTEMQHGVASGRFSVRPDQVIAALAMMSGAVLASIALVLEGHSTWRAAGADMTELVLKALGVPADEARQLATAELPPLLGSRPE